MNTIDRISTISPDLQAKGNRNERSVPADGNNFESQLLEMVKKVENMSPGIDAMIETTNTHNPPAVQKSVNQVGSYIRSIEGLVEDFSVKNAHEIKSHRVVNNPYVKTTKT